MEGGQRIPIFKAVEISVKGLMVVLADKQSRGFVADRLRLFLQYFAFSEIGDAAFCISFFCWLVYASFVISGCCYVRGDGILGLKYISGS